MKFVYVMIICLCTIYNSAAQSLAFAALSLSWKYNIPVSYILATKNDTFEALTMLSLSQLGEVKVS